MPSNMVAQQAVRAPAGDMKTSKDGVRIIEKEIKELLGTCRPREGDTDDFVIWKANLARCCQHLGIDPDAAACS